MFRKTQGKSLLVMSVAVLCALGGSSHGAFFHTAQGIVDGATFGEQFPQVGVVSMLRGTDAGGASGVLIAEDWVLTAGHVLARPGDLTGENIDGIRFRTGSDPFGVGPTHLREADAWFVHPGYTLQTADGVDLALVHLSAPITDVAPASIFDGTVITGMEFYGVGYGEQGSVETGLLPIDWRRRAGGNLTTDVRHGPDDFISSRFDAMDNGGMPDEWLGTGGDSGGGWFVDENGELKLFAINSANLGSSPGYGAFTIGMPIQPHLNWIEETMASVPEPSSGVGAFLMLNCVLIWGIPRRRRMRRFL